MARYKENADMNQYWYSKKTIEFMVQQVTDMCQPESPEGECKTCAFLSTPSIYFSLKDKKVKKAAKVFDVSEIGLILRRLMKLSRKTPDLCITTLISTKS